MGLALWGVSAWATQPITLTQAEVVQSDAAQFPANLPSQTIDLPDDWALTRPDYTGAVWYRIRFDRPSNAATDQLLAIYIERACSNLVVMLNGQLIHTGGSMDEPLTRNCHASQFIALPSSMLKDQHHLLDIKVKGTRLASVSSRQRAAGLSPLQLGTADELAPLYQSKRFWGTSWERASSMIVAALGTLLIVLGILGRREAPLLYLGLLSVSWALVAAALVWHSPPLESSRYELLLAAASPVVGAFAVQFLLSHSGLHSRPLEALLLIQCLIVPATLALASPNHLFVVARAWYTLMTAEIVAATGTHLWRLYRSQRPDFWSMLVVLPLGATVVGIELHTQYSSAPMQPALYLIGLAPGVLLMTLFLMLLLALTRALHAAEIAHHRFEKEAQTRAAEMEQNYLQMADTRVQHVTEAERKRIASDLHDDLGAKLLTIVHTSESERISSLAREALEEMRLSVKGLTGRPMRLMDALADWRAEVVLRLGQAGLEADWRHPSDDTDKALTARMYVQTTRVLRESVSNVIKHSEASLCTITCLFNEHEFSISIQDNGAGIRHKSDHKLDRGHGMASMKHRAKQLNGQCSVESAPGFGTVIRLTIPFDSGVQTV